MKRLLLLVLGFGLFTSANFSYAQGVTTSAMSGVVSDATGETLPGATVIAVHEPTGTKYGAITRANGQFDILNMRVGGPYTLTVSFIGYEDYVLNDIHLSLGNTFEWDVLLYEGDETLDEVVVESRANRVMNSERTGASTSISNEKIQTLPTISRSAEDFTRLTPQSNGNSFGSRNNLYNNFSVDGSIFNNSFGLDAPTPGGQTGAQPVSLDAIDQIEVSVAPYDVRQGGFTGAGVNAVTKSGTNEFSGTVYRFFFNENFIGSEVSGQEQLTGDIDYGQTGFSIGGPIVKNKLFFFGNAEFTRRSDPGQLFRSRNAENREGEAGVSRVEESVLQNIRERLISSYDYDPGRYEGFNFETYNDKALLKLDWNISTDHSLSFRYNYLKSFREQGPHPIAIAPSSRVPGPLTLQFENSGYTINNNINSYVAELNSTFGGGTLANKFQLSYSQFRDFRELPDAPFFPQIDITQDGTTYTTVGTEQFSAENLLDQNVFQVTNNLSYFADKHVITGGVTYEHFDFTNNFNLQRYGYPFFGGLDLERFFEVTDPNNPDFVDLNAIAAAGEGAPIKSVDVTVGQLGIYAQDEYSFSKNLKVTAGLRVDLPIYMTDVARNIQIDTTEFNDPDGGTIMVDVRDFPKSRPLFSPRLGFNWSNEAATTQLRGGTGIFTGRIPFVWIGNQAANARFDNFYTFQINVTGEDFRFPQVWRSNLAVDRELFGGIVGTLEAIYTKDINAVVHKNYNLVTPTERVENTGNDNRLIYPATGPRVYPGFAGPNDQFSFLDAGVIGLENTNEGYQYSLTAQLRKDFDNGLFLTAAYTFAEAKDVTSNPGEIAADAFQRNAVVGNPNFPDLAFSDFGLQHRIIAATGHRYEYADNFATAFSFFFEAGQGNRFSYTYAGDMNRDGIPGNDLIYVPRNEAEANLVDIVERDENGDIVSVITSAEDQWQALDAFISQDDYLSERRGQYAERNGALSPWFTQLDFKLLQDFSLDVRGKKNTLQLSLDVLNLGNLINSNWGVRQIFANNRPIQAAGYDGNTPQFQYFGSGTSFRDNTDLTSRWRMQLGVRYIFN
jgi:hypothetical protein